MHVNTSMSSNIIFQQFLEDTLYPVLFSRADEVFPSMQFTKYRGGWASPCKLNGERSHDNRREKSVITPRFPQVVKEQGGEAKNIISLYQEQGKFSSRMDAIKSLCNRFGLTLPPPPDSEAYRVWQEKQERLEAAVALMKAALFSDEGAATLNYLRQGRGYDDKFIRWAELGFCSERTASTLRAVFTYKSRDGQEVCALPYSVGREQLLAIPYRTGNTIQGLIFRAVDEAVKPKYKDAFISGTASKKYHLFGLRGLPLTGNGEKDRDITIVEGELDALRASFFGVPNVVAASGGEVSSEALTEAKRKGVKRVTLLFDTEGSEEAQADNFKKAAKAIATIQAAGLTSFVAYLPTEGGKVDVDSYLKNHTAEQLQAEIDKAVSGSVFLYERQRAAAVERQGGEGQECTYKNLDEFKRNVVALCNNSTLTSPTDRDVIFRMFAQDTGQYITKESLQEEADRDKAIADANRQKQETISIAAEAYEKAKSGKVDEALSLLSSERLTEIGSISKEAELGKLLELPTEQGIRDSLKARPTGVKTSFAFGQGDKQEQLILPCGALTYICAPTSHGKSRMLENLALQLAKNGERGDVLYFTFEEDSEAVKLELLNIYVGENLSANNLRSLTSYYRTGQNYFRGTNIDLFRRKEAEFFKLLTGGKLRVFYKDYDSSDLIAAIRFMSRNIPVKAVFIDYIQLLHKRGTRLQRKDELKEICADLMKLAVDTELPVVLAAQLNREALSPVEMAVQNIAEASDIEHSANIVMLLWNSATKPLPKSGYIQSYAKGGETKYSKEAEELEGRNGFHIGQAGHLYAILAKNRGGARNIDAVLSFKGNAGLIEPNYTEPDPKQEELPFAPPSEGDNYDF